MSEPRWLTRMMVDAIHTELISGLGGSSGVRDEGLIESALARPRNRHAYDPEADLATLAAAYLYGLTKNHGYVDGKQRVGFMAAYTFLGLNGRTLTASEPDAYEFVDGIAAGRYGEEEAAEWLRAQSRPR